MHESSRSHSNTHLGELSAGAGSPIGPVNIGVGGSVRNTSTDVAGSARGHPESSTRRHATPRRSGASWSAITRRSRTSLTLLNAKYVGTPYLSFSLSPQPLTSSRSTRPIRTCGSASCWRGARRGIEGIQEFTAVVVVPRDEGFCVNARLRRVCVLDVPPGPLELRGAVQLAAAPRPGAELSRSHITRRARRSTTSTSISSRPAQDPGAAAGATVPGVHPAGARVLRRRRLRHGRRRDLADAAAVPGAIVRASVNYKRILELWLETLRDEYEREAARSPLERGILMGEDRFLDTCFAFSAANGGGFAVSDSNALGRARCSGSRSIRRDYRHRRHHVHGELGAQERARARLRNGDPLEPAREPPGGAARQPPPHRRAEKPLTFDPDVVDVLRRAVGASCRRRRRRNLDFDEAAQAAAPRRRAAPPARRRRGATDLRGIAQASSGAATIDRYNEADESAAPDSPGREAPGPAPEPVRWPLSARDAATLRKAIGDGLECERRRQRPRRRRAPSAAKRSRTRR